MGDETKWSQSSQKSQNLLEGLTRRFLIAKYVSELSHRDSSKLHRKSHPHKPLLTFTKPKSAPERDMSKIDDTTMMKSNLFQLSLR